MQKARSHISCMLLLLVGNRFQFLFHSPCGVLFTFPSRYLFAIGHVVVFSLRRWSSWIPTGFLVSCGTQGIARNQKHFEYGAFTLYDAPFHVLLLYFLLTFMPPYNPTCVVWALPSSLATTKGISFDFFSFGYWDVSLPRVRLICLSIQHMILELLLVGSPIQVSTIHWVVHLSSWLFAVSHAFLRLHLPRHPPVALIILFFLSFLSIQLSIFIRISLL